MEEDTASERDGTNTTNTSDIRRNESGPVFLYIEIGSWLWCQIGKQLWLLIVKIQLHKIQNPLFCNLFMIRVRPGLHAVPCNIDIDILGINRWRGRGGYGENGRFVPVYVLSFLLAL